MKKLILLASFAVFIFSCGEKKSSASKPKEIWPKESRDDYMKSCVQGAEAQMGKDKAKTYCSCTLDKMQTKYPNPIDALSIDMQALMELAKDCL